MSNGWRAAGLSRRWRHVACTVAMVAGMAVFTGCTGDGAGDRRESKLLTIHRHHFDPAVITVKANQGFDLVVSANDMAELTIASPAIGVETIRVPPLRRADDPIRPLTLADYRAVRVPLGPLPPGIYVMTCDCHGTVSVGKLVVR